MYSASMHFKNVQNPSYADTQHTDFRSNLRLLNSATNFCLVLSVSMSKYYFFSILHLNLIFKYHLFRIIKGKQSLENSERVDNPNLGGKHVGKTFFTQIIENRL
jgi:hypothetical protein